MKLFSQDTKVQALKSVPLFASLSRKELIQLERVCEDLEVEPGTVLCKEGEIGHEFFVRVNGEVQVTRKGRRVPCPPDIHTGEQACRGSGGRCAARSWPRWRFPW